MTYEEDLLREAREAMHEISDLLGEIRELTADFAQQAEQEESEDQAHDRERAEKARSGELGPHWRRLQERIDRGETDLTRIARGWDDSPDAEAAMTDAYRNMDDVRRAVDEAAATPAGEPLPEIHIKGTPAPPGTIVTPAGRAAMRQAMERMQAIREREERIRAIPIEPLD